MEPIEHALGPQHLGGCVALSKAASWNQNEADWRLMLGMGRGWGLTLADGTLAASTLVLPYGKFAWVSMVLVLPEQRRKGYASRLLRLAIADLENRGQTPILDATPAGREVYRQAGFRETWGFKRFFLKELSHSVAAGEAVREIREADWPEILRMDSKAFGSTRESLLRALRQRLPQAALMIGDEGFVLGREGREARQIGPLVACDEQAAKSLLEHALSAVEPPLYVDVVDHAPELSSLLEARGFVFQRPFTRMVRGADRAPGNEKAVFLVAGPELG
jgi:GNAT superfamily N-acetyltransferase